MSDPTKFELAQYLVNLHILMEAQRIFQQPSNTLMNEYNFNWGLLKDSITEPKETEDETRTSDLSRG